MKFSLISVATLAIAGLASAAVVPCQNVVANNKALDCASFAQQNGLSVDAFVHINKFQTVADCDAALAVIDSVCVDQKHSHNKRCLAEKKAAEKKAAEEKAAAEKKAAEEKAAAEKKKQEQEQEEEKPAAPSGSGPSPQAIPASQAGSLRIVNKADENCTWYYVITAADSGCDDVATKNGITKHDLYNLNRNLHRVGVHECDNLDDGKAYCVSTN